MALVFAGWPDHLEGPSLPAALCARTVEPTVDAILGAAGKGGAAVIGHVGDSCAGLATELLRAGVHVMVYDVNSCASGEWEGLEKVAQKAGLRLECGSHIARYSTVMRHARNHVRDSAAISTTVMGPHPDMRSVCALSADIAMFALGSAPQAVFASSPRGEDDDDQEGEERRLGDSVSLMMRFEGDRTAFVSIGSAYSGGCIQFPIDREFANSEIVLTATGMGLNHADLSSGKLSVRYNDGMGGPDYCPMCHPGEEHVHPASLYGDPDGELGCHGLMRHLPSMLVGLETGIDPAGLHSQGAWQSWAVHRLLPSRPSSLAHVMEAMLVSINTGAPVYLDQR